MCVPSWITPRGYSTEWSKKWESAVITARPRRAAPRHAASVGIDRAERQKIIPANEDPGGLASLQGSRINDLGAMIFRILRGNTVRRFNVFPGRSPWISRAREPCRVNEYMYHDWNETLWRRLHGSGSDRFHQTDIEILDRKLYAARKRLHLYSCFHRIAARTRNFLATWKERERVTDKKEEFANFLRV